MDQPKRHSIWKGALVGGAALGALGAAVAGLGSDFIEEVVLMPEAQGLMDHLAKSLNNPVSPLNPDLMQELNRIVSIQPVGPGMAMAGDGMRQFLVPVSEDFIKELAGKNITLPSYIAAVNVLQGAEISPELRTALGSHADHLIALTQADKILPPMEAAAIGGLATGAVGAGIGAGVQATRNLFKGSQPKPVVGERTQALAEARQAPASTVRTPG